MRASNSVGPSDAMDLTIDPELFVWGSQLEREIEGPAEEDESPGELQASRSRLYSQAQDPSEGGSDSDDEFQSDSEWIETALAEEARLLSGSQGAEDEDEEFGGEDSEWLEAAMLAEAQTGQL